MEIGIDRSQVGVDVPVGPTGASDPAASWSADLDFAPYAAQTVTVEARRYDADGSLLDTDAVTVTVREAPNQAPTARIDGSGSSDPDGTITDWTWDMGDGTVLSGQTVTHTYSEPGPVDVVLTVTDDDGATDTATFRHVVTGPPR